MHSEEQSKRREAAVDAVLAKMPTNPDNDRIKAEVRTLIRTGGNHEKIAIYRLLETLANYPT